MAKKRARQRSAPAVKRGGSGGFSLASLSFLSPQMTAPETPPWRWLLPLLGVAFALRAAVALAGDFVIHPDEIMQYLEPAHGAVFGNGVSYWEFYYGARSWLIPSVVAAVLWLCKLIGLDSPAYYVAAVKLFFCALSLLIPLALYHLGRRMFGEGTGRLALILGVFWYELVGFAHKPMSEFVATSLLFAFMLFALRPQRLTARQGFLAGLFGLLIVAVRFQYIPIMGIIMLVPFIRGGNQTRLMMIAGSAAALAIVGVFDHLTWGGFFHSYWLNLQANFVLNQYRGDESSAWYFIGWPIVASGGLFLLALASLLNYQRRLFLLLLFAAVLLPHMTQAHREYRFMFVLIPFWLLLFADLLAIGWQQQRQSAPKMLFARGRRIAGIAFAALASAGGIANALPLQYWVYEAKSQETGYVHFLRYQDEIFSLYRRLAADDTVRGVHDLTRPYFNGGGYYYLHRRVPFYSSHTGVYPPAEAAQYVSHIIAPAMVTPAGVAATASGRAVMQTEGGGLVALPGYLSDATLGKLVHWDARGQSSVVEGFALEHESENFTLWRAETDAPVRGWRDYKIAPDSDAMHPVVQQAIGDYLAPPPQFGIEFAEENQ